MKAANTKIQPFQKCSFSECSGVLLLLFAFSLPALFLTACSGNSAALEAEASAKESAVAEIALQESSKAEMEESSKQDETAPDPLFPKDAAASEPSYNAAGYSEESNELNAADEPVHADAVIAAATVPADDQFVRVDDYIPSIITDLKYATTDNFTGEVIYPFTNAYLRYGTVRKLQMAQQKLQNEGYCLKIWDAFRPVSAQFKLWEICPDSTYVANPYTGYSSHSRGNTVDISLVNVDGSEMPMPTGFDDFSAKADRDYSDCTDEEASNAKKLESVMIECGFKPYFGEWWHFSDQTAYDVDSSFEPD